MTYLNRRRFLQFSGSALAAMGLNALDIKRQGDRYGRVLAQPTSRKLALLVGINAYSQDAVGWAPLRGCLTDIQMQEELLVHRFGFNRDDIHILKDTEATRDGILTAFDQHLLQQAKEGDVVVFHFSGHGSRLIDPTPYREDTQLNSSFVPIDSALPANFREAEVEVQDIMGATMFLLRNALPTEHVTFVFDSCFSGGGKRGTVTFRARDGADLDYLIYPSQVELEYQAQLLTDRLKWTSDEFIRRRQNGIDKGVVIAAATEREKAADASFKGFYAGAFTYAMTQHLWQETGNVPVERTFVNINRIASDLAMQFDGRVQSANFDNNAPDALAQSPMYFIPKSAPAAEAVVTERDDAPGIWLGGVHPDNLETYDYATFRALDAQQQPIGKVQTVQRNGIVAQGRWIEGNAPTGQSIFLQEEIRGIPADFALQIGLDESLTEEEIAAATQALAAIPQLQPKPISEGGVDYILGRMTPELRQRQALDFNNEADIPQVDSFGLFLPGERVLVGSFAEPGESITDTVEWLRPKFSQLLAARILRLLVNPGSAQLDVTTSLIPVGTSAQAVGRPIEVRGRRGVTQDESEDTAPPPAGIPADASRLPLETLIQVEVKNNEPQDLYVGILLVQPSGKMDCLFPTNYNAPETAAIIGARTTLTVPDRNRGDNFNLRLAPPTGKHEILVIASTAPIDDALREIGRIADRRGTRSGQPLAAGEDFLEFSQLLVNELDRNTRNQAQPSTSSDRTRYISGAEMIAFSIVFEVYDPAIEPGTNS